MENSMPKIFIFNIEEVADEINEKQRNIFIYKILKIFPRFLFCLSSGDKIILPDKIDKKFAFYVSRILSLGKINDFIFFLKNKSKPYFLCDSILSDTALKKNLDKKVSSNFTIEPYIDTPKIYRLSKELNIKYDKRKEKIALSGKALLINDKSEF